MIEKKDNKILVLGAVLTMLSALIVMCLSFFTKGELTLFHIMKDIPIYFHIDTLGKWFVTIFTIVWVLVSVYSIVYMKHEGGESRFVIFYLLVYWILVGLCFSGNLVTMYLFYEFMTVASFPMIMHNGTKEAIMAGLKYLFYSMCGAYMGLFGIIILYRNTTSLTFTAGGNLDMAVATGNNLVLIAVLVMVIGFGAKAGMFPLHSWLPIAHPVAPSPISAVMSAIIAKAGVLAIVRTLYYVVGAEYIRGTWVQTALLILSLITVFMGSLLAFREKVFKKRLAYSTVSQVSYVLFGFFVFTADGFSGAMLHVMFHAVVKTGLFLTAGIFIICLGKTRVEELVGVGKRMPAAIWCYTFFALALIGIPPTSGFVSKWYLAEGALSASIGVFRYIGPAVLLVSALLTAGYLLPIVMKGFFPGDDVTLGKEMFERKEPPKAMLIPLIILAVLAVIFGVLPNFLTEFVSGIGSALM